mgnify:CR=1 FL=1
MNCALAYLPQPTSFGLLAWSGCFNLVGSVALAGMGMTGITPRRSGGNKGFSCEH